MFLTVPPSKSRVFGKQKQFLRALQKLPIIMNSKCYQGFSPSKTVCYAGLLFLRLQTEFFFCFQVRVFPEKRGNRAGSFRNESAYSRRGTRISFPLLDCRGCENFGVAHFATFLLKKQKLIKQSPHFDELS